MNSTSRATMSEQDFEQFCDEMELSEEGRAAGAAYFAHPPIYATLIDLVNQIGTLSHAVDLIRKEMFYGDPTRAPQAVAASAASRVLAEPYEPIEPRLPDDFDMIQMGDFRTDDVEIAKMLVRPDPDHPDQRWMKFHGPRRFDMGNHEIGRLIHGMLGLLGDASELSQEVTHVLTDPDGVKPYEEAKLRSALECGDIRVWLRFVEHYLDKSPGRVRAMVANKLTARHQGKKFDPSTGEAGARDYEAEEAAAESAAAAERGGE